MNDVERATQEATVRGVTLDEFIHSEWRKMHLGKYIRMFYDAAESELRFYRETPAGNGLEYIRTAVTLRESRISGEEPLRWNLHNGDAENVLTFLSTLSEDAEPSFRWYQSNNSPLVEEAGLQQETLILSEDFEVVIHNVYRNTEQMMASWK